MKVILNVVLRKHISNENCDYYSLWQKDSIKCNTANLPYTRIMLMMRLELKGVRFHKVIMALLTG